MYMRVPGWRHERLKYSRCSNINEFLWFKVLSKGFPSWLMRGAYGNSARNLGGGDERSSRTLESNYRSLRRLHTRWRWDPRGEKWTLQLIWSPIIQFVFYSHRFTPIFSPEHVYFIQYLALLARLMLMSRYTPACLLEPRCSVGHFSLSDWTLLRFGGRFMCENVDLWAPAEAPRCFSSSSPPPPSSSTSPTGRGHAVPSLPPFALRPFRPF